MKITKRIFFSRNDNIYILKNNSSFIEICLIKPNLKIIVIPDLFCGLPEI